MPDIRKCWCRRLRCRPGCWSRRAVARRPLPSLLSCFRSGPSAAPPLVADLAFTLRSSVPQPCGRGGRKAPAAVAGWKRRAPSRRRAPCGRSLCGHRVATRRGHGTARHRRSALEGRRRKTAEDGLALALGAFHRPGRRATAGRRSRRFRRFRAPRTRILQRLLLQLPGHRIEYRSARWRQLPASWCSLVAPLDSSGSTVSKSASA